MKKCVNVFIFCIADSNHYKNTLKNPKKKYKIYKNPKKIQNTKKYKKKYKNQKLQKSKILQISSEVFRTEVSKFQSQNLNSG